MERCIQKVSARYVEIGLARVRAKRTFFVRMIGTYGRGGATHLQHRRALEQCFLPLFQHKGGCLFFARAEPDKIAARHPGLAIAPVDDAWCITPTSAFDGSFPYWTDDMSTAAKYEKLQGLALMLSVDLNVDESQLDSLLGHVWDPTVWTNAEVVIPPRALKFARRTSRNRRGVWLVYRINPIEMRIAVVGATPSVAYVYERALRLARASRSFGNEFYNEERAAKDRGRS